jgi:hypothetical protein
MTHKNDRHGPFGFGLLGRVVIALAATTAFPLGCTPGSPGGAPQPIDPASVAGKPGDAGKNPGDKPGGATAGNDGGRADPDPVPADAATSDGAGKDATGAPATRDATPSDATGNPAGDASPTTPVDDLGLGHLSRVVPVLWITVDGKPIPRDTKITGRIKVIEDHDGSLAGIMARPATLDAPIGIEARGQSSFSFDQKPYGFEVRDDTGKGQSVPLLGLPPESDFVLHSCYADKSCVRNALTYQVGREMAAAGGRWAPRTRYVEVYLDGKYQGLYLLVERIKRDKARVNLPPPAADATAGDLSGGYIFSQEGDGGRAGEDFPSAFDVRGKMVYRYPKADTITPAQKTYLQGAIKSLAQTLTTETGLSDTVRKRIDVDSFVDYAIVQELTNNVDAFWKSWFFYKAPDGAGGRFFLGPLWDFDLGYGNIIFKKRYCSNTSASSELGGPIAKLVNHQEFKDAVRCRWNSLRAPGGPLDLDHMEKTIMAFAQHISRAKARDGERWHNIGAWVWPNNYIGGTWDDEVTYLRYWLRRRLSWLDKSLTGTCPAVPAPPAVTLIASPPHVMESNTRMPYIGRDAPEYIPIEGPLPANLASWACPK